MVRQESAKLVIKSASPSSNPVSPALASPVRPNTNPSNPPKVSTPKK